MIQLGGLASGLDTGAIIEAILNVERVPINALEQDRQDEQQKISLFGTLKGHVQSLRDKAEALSSLSGLLQYSVTPSQDGIASFSVSGAPTAGSHTLEVTQLAQASRFTFTDVVTDPDTDLGAGDISFDVNGTSYTVSLSATGSSLNEIATEINSLAGDDVTANVVNIGTDSSPQYQLVVAGDETGLSNAITGLTSSIAGLTDANIEELTTAQNAIAVVDGLTVQRDSNTFADVIDGITFEAQSLTSSQISFSTAIDGEAVRGQVQEFVDAYNEVIDFIASQSTYSEDDGAGGPLFGDSALRTVRSTISNALFDVDISTVIADSTGFSTLNLLGIDVGTDGRLSIDEETFDAKLAEDPDAFADLFVDTDGFDNGGAAENTAGYYTDTTTDDGLFDNLFRAIDQLVDDVTLSDGTTLDGLFSRREDTINANIERIADRIEALELRLLSTEETLVQRFAALEEVVAGLNAQGGFLAQSLSSNQGSNSG